MKKLTITNSLLLTSGAILGTADATSNPVLGQKITVQKSGLCNVVSCKGVVTKTLSPTVQTVWSENGAAALFIDGKLAALGRNVAATVDPEFPRWTEVAALAKLGTGEVPPQSMLVFNRDKQTYKPTRSTGPNTHLDLSSMVGKSVVMSKGVFATFATATGYSLLLVEKQYLPKIRQLVGRNTLEEAQKLLKQFFDQQGIKAEEVNATTYRMRNTKANWDAFERYMIRNRSLVMPRLSGANYLLPDFSGLSINASGSMPNGQPLDPLGPEPDGVTGPYIYLQLHTTANPSPKAVSGGAIITTASFRGGQSQVTDILQF